MTIDFFSDCLRLIALVFERFPPCLWLLCCAIICSLVTIIKSFISLR